MSRFPSAAPAFEYSPRRFSAARLAAKCCLSRPHCTIASETGFAALTVTSRSRSLPVSVSFSAGFSSLGARPSTRATTSRASASFSCRHLANRMAQSSRFKASPSAPQPDGRAMVTRSASRARCATVLSKSEAVCVFSSANTPLNGSNANNSSIMAVRRRSQGCAGRSVTNSARSVSGKPRMRSPSAFSAQRVSVCDTSAASDLAS